MEEKPFPALYKLRVVSAGERRALTIVGTAVAVVLVAVATGALKSRRDSSASIRISDYASRAADSSARARGIKKKQERHKG